MERRILVIEDHEATLAWWMEALPAAFPGARVEGAETLAGAKQALMRASFWMALVDLQLPDGSGVSLLADLRRHAPETWRVVCSVHQDDAHVFAALRAGAQGYLVKDQPRERQLALLREILDGRPPLSAGVARRILDHFGAAGGSGEEAAALTAREREILRLVAKGFSRPEVADMLGLSLNTVATHCKHIYRKLDVGSRAEAVIEAIRQGLIEP